MSTLSVYHNDKQYLRASDIFDKHNKNQKHVHIKNIIDDLKIPESEHLFASISKTNGITILDVTSRYKARKLFISESWIFGNGHKLTSYFNVTKPTFDSIDTPKSFFDLPKRNDLVYIASSPLMYAVKIGIWSGTIRSLFSRYMTYYGPMVKLSVYFSKAKETKDTIEKKFCQHFNENHIGGEIFDKSCLNLYKSYLQEHTKNDAVELDKSILNTFVALHEIKQSKKKLCALPSLILFDEKDRFYHNDVLDQTLAIRGDRSFNGTFFKSADIGKIFNVKKIRNAFTNTPYVYIEGLHYVFFSNVDLHGNKDTLSNNPKVLYLTGSGLMKFIGSRQKKSPVHDCFIEWFMHTCLKTSK